MIHYTLATCYSVMQAKKYNIGIKRQKKVEKMETE